MSLKCHRRFVATVFEVGARRVFPCLDEPMFKTTFNITMKHFLNFFSLSNMPAKNIETQTYMILTSFNETPVISTYAVAITLLELTDISLFNNTWYHKLPSPYIKFLGYLVNNVTEHMKSKEWKNFNITTLKHVAIPNYPYESREYFGLIFYRYYTLLYIKKK